jgi:branched-chain amino acid transport system ATP-binding protein
MLVVEALDAGYGDLRVLRGLTLAVEAGEVLCLMGRNGAGKTTLVSLLCGRLLPDAGTIAFMGRDITRLPAHVRARLGIAYTFQITAIFRHLPVFDNVALAVQRRGARDLRPETLATLARVGLLDRAAQLAGTLAYGHQRLLEIAMGLALAPRLLILDEPTQGLAAGEIAGFKTLVRDIAKTATVLLIEHDMEVVMDLAQRITVLVAGRVLATGTPAAIRADQAVQAAYLGP